MNKIWWFWIYFLLFLSWFILPLPGCALLRPPTLSEVEKTVLRESGGVELAAIRPRINWFDNTWTATFLIHCPDNTNLRLFLSARQTIFGEIVVKELYGQSLRCQDSFFSGQEEKPTQVLSETKIKEEKL